MYGHVKERSNFLTYFFSIVFLRNLNTVSRKLLLYIPLTKGFLTFSGGIEM